MGKDKKFITIIIGLILIIVGLVAFIIFGKDPKNDNTAETTAENVTSTASDSEAKDESNKDKEKSETTENKDNKDDKAEVKEERDIYAKLSFQGNPWGDQPTNNIEITIVNDSSSPLTDWEVRIAGFKGASIEGSWNGKFEIKDDILYIKSTGEDWNKTVDSKNKMNNIGATIKFASKASYDSVAKAVPEVYSAGKLAGNVLNSADKKDADEKKDGGNDSDKKEENKDSASDKKVASADKEGTPLSNHGKLRLEGTDLVDKNGEVYQLKGVSTHGLAWFPQYVNKDAFQTFRDDWGANLIRLAMYTGESGGYCQDGNKDDLKKLVSSGVDYATELGMYVIVDWHILSDNDPNINKEEALKFFDEMSKKYAGNDNVLYEICNEPNGGTEWGSVKSYAEEVIPLIRKNDKDAIIIVGTPTWSQDVDIAANDPVSGYSNIMYTLHFYAATHKGDLRAKLETARSKGLPIFISEFSICDASGNGSIDYDSAAEWFDLINKYHISYAGWNVSNKDETSSLIKSSSDKTSGWTTEDLSETGKWLKDQMKK